MSPTNTTPATNCVFTTDHYLISFTNYSSPNAVSGRSLSCRFRIKFAEHRHSCSPPVGITLSPIVWHSFCTRLHKHMGLQRSEAVRRLSLRAEKFNG